MAVAAADWVELVDLLHRFTWVIDQGETSLLDGMLASEVCFDAEAVRGRPSVIQSAADFLAGLTGNARAYDGLQHLVGNEIVEVDADRRRAVVRSYAHVSLSIGALDAPIKRNAVCYRLEAVRGAEAESPWLISTITVRPVWDEPNSAVTAAAQARRNG